MKNDILSKDTINALLSGSVFDVLVEDELTSTNTSVRKQAELGAKEGLVIIAKKQTGGRGRMGRTFHSPDNSGLYMSLLLRPSFPPSETLFITCAASVAVCRALEKFSNKKMGIKWVNDIYSEGRKLCGILTEASFSAGGDKLNYAVLGIGINVYTPNGGFDPEIADIAGAVFSPEEAKENLKNQIAASVLSEFWKIYKEDNHRAFTCEYKRRSILIGKKVDVVRLNEIKTATVLSIGDDLRLNVVYNDGTKESLSSGEVSIKKISH